VKDYYYLEQALVALNHGKIEKSIRRLVDFIAEQHGISLVEYLSDESVKAVPISETNESMGE
jgi:hypothetical protein